MPKVDTQASSFVQEKQYNGKGVIVAIFDTGVDPGAVGLKTTPDGRPKIIDIVDCTGSNDIIMAPPAKVQDDGTLKGLTGRTLRFNPTWKNPSGTYRLGLKRAFELFPKTLVGRMKRERRKAWDIRQNALLESAYAALASFDESPAAKSNPKQRPELEKKVKLLEAMQQGYDDAGPIFDVVAFFDGKCWRAAVDTSETGDLSTSAALTNFRDERQYSTFGDVDLCNYVLNIYDDGAVVSIANDAGAHGTHVAGIVAGYDVEQPELNGVAPGAQIVSCKIGDTRISGMETARGLVRALNVALQNGCDVINMSYGEPVQTPVGGRFGEIVKEFVNKHGLIFVTSAGNAGPALTTVGAPATSSSRYVIGVGAYVNSSMGAAEYSLLQKLPPTNYTWSSRGPTKSGAAGVCISAPGGAISSVPNWTLKRNMLMNGTSMASPNACGGVALVLSGLKAQGVSYTPHTIRRALENTAKHVDNVSPWSQGCGLLQVLDAFNYVVEHAKLPCHELRYRLSIPALFGGQAQGIYLREPHEIPPADGATQVKVFINPDFHPDASSSDKVAFSGRLKLVATQPWVKVPEYYHFCNNRGIVVRVSHPSTPAVPGAHFAEILGFDARPGSESDTAPLVRIPVTLVESESVDENADGRVELGDMSFVAGQIQRRFIKVPAGATWLDLNIRSKLGASVDTSDTRLMVVHCQQLRPHEAHRDAHMLEKYFRLAPWSEHPFGMAVHEGGVVEVTIAQFWSSLGSTVLTTTLDFNGVVPTDASFSAGSSYHRVDVCARGPKLLGEVVEPNATLTHLERHVYPSSFEVRALGKSDTRDAFPGSRSIYSMVLTYNLTVSVAGPVTVMPGAMDKLLYDSPFGSQMRLMFDDKKRVVMVSDAWGKGYASQSLKPGKYVVKMEIRHDNVKMLQAVKNTPLSIKRKLAKEVKLNAYSNMHNLVAKGAKFKGTRVRRGESVAVFFESPTQLESALPKDATAGTSMVGSVTYAKRNDAIAGSSKRPGGFPLRVNLVPQKAAPTDPHKKASEAAIAKAKEIKAAESTPAESLQNAVRDAKIKFLATLSGKSAKKGDWAELHEQLTKEYPKHLPLCEAALVHYSKLLNSATTAEDVTGLAGQVNDSVDAILECVDVTALAATLGTAVPENDAALKKAVDAAQKKRKTLYDAFCNLALARLRVFKVNAKAAASTPAEAKESEAASSTAGIEAAFDNAQKWSSSKTDPYLVRIKMALHRVRGELAQALGEVNTLIGKATATAPAAGLTCNQLHTARLELLEGLGLDAWKNYYAGWHTLKNPHGYARL